MRITRILLVLTGVGMAAYGGLLLLDQQAAALGELALWAVAAVLLHDAVLVPATLLAGWLLARMLPSARRAPMLVCAVVLCPLSLAAVPVLGGWGARSDNPTLLDRPYLPTLVALWTVGLAAAVAAGVVRSAHSTAGEEVADGPDPGGGRRQDGP